MENSNRSVNVSGLLTNIGTMVVAPHQYAEFSSKTRTALYRNGQYQVQTQPGSYRFAKFTIMDHASTRFQVEGRFVPCDVRVSVCRSSLTLSL